MEERHQWFTWLTWHTACAATRLAESPATVPVSQPVWYRIRNTRRDPRGVIGGAAIDCVDPVPHTAGALHVLLSPLVCRRPSCRDDPDQHPSPAPLPAHDPRRGTSTVRVPCGQLVAEVLRYASARSSRWHPPKKLRGLGRSSFLGIFRRATGAGRDGHALALPIARTRSNRYRPTSCWPRVVI